MFLLCRSTDLEEEEETDSSELTDTVVIVETQPQRMGYLSVILESLGFETLNVTGEAVAMRLIREKSPRMVLSTQKLTRLKGYSQLGDAPRPAPFVYVPDSQGQEGFDLHGDRVLQEVGETVPEEKTDNLEERELNPASEESLATAEDIVRGFRDSGTEEEGSASEGAEAPTEDPDVEKDQESELDRIQRYRAEYQVQQETQGERNSGSGSTRQTQEAEEAPPVERENTGKDEKIQESTISAEDLASAVSEEDYSIIERINAEEIERLTHGDVLSEKVGRSSNQGLYREMTSYVLKAIRTVDRGRIPDLVKGESIAERVVSSIETGSELLLEATDRRQQFAISTHSVNTSIFAVRIAQTLGLSIGQQLKIALAALLHEIGVVRLPEQLVYKTEKPTLEEIKILRKRPIFAARCLKHVDSQYDWLTEVVSQVYERENGTGHPMGLTGREISEEAKVIGIADLFDACIHRRPYREALTGYQALFELTTDQARTFSDRIVKALIKSLSLFPYNEFVVLSSGEIGKVIEINLENLSRPVVELLYDQEGSPVEMAEPIDLAQNPSLYISKALPFRNLPSQ
jgi:HD-GYP domain-containing protein (c-di-GMP phosphodiesterase class II)